MATKKPQPVIVTTKFRGVFFGYLRGVPSQERAELTQCRNVLRFGDAKGFLGLAANGPGAGARVGPAAPSITLYEITAVIECTSAAAERFEEGPWS